MRRLVILLFIVIAGLAQSQASATSVLLSPEEQVWLQEHKTIRISGPQAFPPFQYIGQDGTFKGMATDYILHIAKIVGLEVEVAEKQPWPTILDKIEGKEIDLLTCVGKTVDRSNYLLYTRPHLSFPLVIISRKDAPFIAGLQSLHRKSIAVPRKNLTIDWLHRDRIEVFAKNVDSPLDALKAVSLGKVDVAIENLAAATYLIEQHGLTNLKIAAPTSYENYNLSIGVRKDWPELVSIMDKGLASMSQEMHNEIRQRWIAVRYEHGVGVVDIIKWVLLVAGLAGLFIAFFYIWNRKLAQEVVERKRAELEKEKLIDELTGALKEIKVLRGILPICCECKSIRDDQGYWNQIESYIGEHSEADFSHGIFPECLKKLYGDEDWYQKHMKTVNNL